MPLLNFEGCWLQIDMFELETHGFRYARPSRNACFANEQLRFHQPCQYFGGLLLRENTIRTYAPLPADFHARHRIRKRLVQVFPFLDALENPPHDIPQIDHHLPGGALLLEPVQNLFGMEFSESGLLPTR